MSSMLGLESVTGRWTSVGCFPFREFWCIIPSIIASVTIFAYHMRGSPLQCWLQRCNCSKLLPQNDKDSWTSPLVQPLCCTLTATSVLVACANLKPVTRLKDAYGFRGCAVTAVVTNLTRSKAPTFYWPLDHYIRWHHLLAPSWTRTWKRKNINTPWSVNIQSPIAWLRIEWIITQRI